MSTQICLTFNPNQRDISLDTSNEKAGQVSTQNFTFDRVFNVNSTQKEVYDISARPIINSKMDY